MTWSVRFREGLRDDPGLVFRVQIRRDVGRVARYPLATADDGRAPRAYPWICGPLAESGLSLSLRSWSSAAGSLTIPVAADRERVALLRQAWKIGDRVEIFATLSDRSATERIWLGRVDDLVWDLEASILSVICSDAVAMTQSRSGQTSWQEAIFPELAKERSIYSLDNRSNIEGILLFALDFLQFEGNAARITGGFTPGTSSTLHVSSTTFFTAHGLGYDFPSATATGGAMVQPDSGEPYLVLYTGTGSGTLTGLDYAVTYSGSPPDPPFAHVGSHGGSVAPASWIAGHPFDVIRAFLTSTGTGANGPHDVVPADHALGLGVRDLDNGDIRRHRGIVQTSDAALVSMTNEDPGVIWRWAAALGIWPVMRHGHLTLRSCVDPHNPNHARNVAGSISDSQILGIGRQGGRAQGMDVEVNRLVVQHSDWSYPSATPGFYAYGANGGSGYARPRTSPAVQERSYDLTRHLWRNTSGTTDQDIEERLAPWWSRIAGFAEVELTADALSYVAGDTVTVSSLYLQAPDGSIGLTDQPAMIIPSERVWQPAPGGVRSVRALLVFLPDW